MDDREALRITIAGARKKAGKATKRPDVTAAVKDGVLQALNEWEPAAEQPAQFDALDPSVSADAMRKLFPEADPQLWRDRVPGTPRPATIKPVSETERVRMAKRAEQITAGAVDLRTASPERAAARLRQL